MNEKSILASIVLFSICFQTAVRHFKPLIICYKLCMLVFKSHAAAAADVVVQFRLN